MLIARSLDALAFDRGTAILACECRAGERVPPYAGLVVRTMQSGRELHCLAQRVMSVDADSYLIVPPRRASFAVYVGDRPLRALAVHFEPAAVARAGAGATQFLECLRPRGDAAGQRLSAIAAHIDRGPADTAWLEQQVFLLLHDMLEGEHELRRRAGRIDCVKAATRDELYRRVLLAADFIHSHYDRPISLDAIAGAARLSRFHLLRLFRRTQGITPRAFLLAKRVAVATRLLAQTDCDLAEIAERCGFGTRSSLYRHLQKERGTGGRRLRAHLAPRLDRTWTIAA